MENPKGIRYPSLMSPNMKLALRYMCRRYPEKKYFYAADLPSGLQRSSLRKMAELGLIIETCHGYSITSDGLEWARKYRKA